VIKEMNIFKKIPFSFWGIGLFSLMLSITGVAQQNLVVENAYIPAMPPTMKNSAAYFTLHNHGTDEVVLTGARSEIAERVELHETVNHEGQMRMNRVQNMEVVAGGSLVLESGGLHFMLMGLKSAPVPGENISLILEFEGEYELPLTLPVQSLLPDDDNTMDH
jgi:copper(I)-binding protein